MRYRGTITDWEEDRGFGFIRPATGRAKVFVHVSAFGRGTPRPREEQTVLYEIGTDATGRCRAENAELVGCHLPVTWSADGLLALPILFILALFGAVATGKLPHIIPLCYLAASVITFSAYASDKAAAKANRWRTRETTLHAMSLAGGWPGGLLAQRFLRHKSRKISFQYLFWLTVVLNTCALAWLVSSPDSVAWSLLGE